MSSALASVGVFAAAGVRSGAASVAVAVRVTTVVASASGAASGGTLASAVASEVPCLVAVVALGLVPTKNYYLTTERISYSLLGGRVLELGSKRLDFLLHSTYKHPVISRAMISYQC